MKKHDLKVGVTTPDLTKEGKKKDVFKTPTSCNPEFLKSNSKTRSTLVRNHTSNSQMSKSSSTPLIPEKCINLMKVKNKVLETPVSHLCSTSLSPKGRRYFAQHSNSVKRFLSDCNLNNSLNFNKEDVTSTPKDNTQQQEEENSNFIVGVRVRPFNLRELNDIMVKNVVQMKEDEVIVTCDKGAIHSFTYDHCFWSFDKSHPKYASQETIFTIMVLPLMNQMFLGCNACLVAYGQTGSGKSYSMMGLDSGIPGQLGEESGVIPRFFQELFKRKDEIEKEDGEILVEISYFEIYNEKIHDLLRIHTSHSLRKSLKVREHPIYGPYVVDLSAHSVKSFADVQEWITVGNSQRITAATGMNEKSSRSHSIFSVTVTQKHKRGSLNVFRSKVNLVDLAGSERVAQTCASGHKLKEGVSINKSLLSLGKVIMFLAERGRKKTTSNFGSYRESVLTWLLRESLGGNSKTAMLATISPANIHLDETLATLRYACQARSIVNRVYKNEDANDRMIRELKAEVEKITMLKQELDKMKKMVESSETKEKEEEIDRLKKQLQSSEELLAKSQVTWAERLQEAENLKAAELQYLKKCGVAIGLQCDKEIPCLVNLAADPMLTGTLLYLLPPGRLVVGRSLDVDSKEKQPDIGLSGPLINFRHCEIENREGKLFLLPVEGSDTFVNGQAVKEEIELLHNYRVVFGGIHYFRVSIPSQSESSIRNSVDFDFAHQEILKIQEARLRAELEESKQKAILKLEGEMESLLGAQKFDYERQLNEMLTMVEIQSTALAEERKQKYALEVERNVLQEKVNNHNNSQKIINDGENIAKKMSPYKSTFLEDLKFILEGEFSDLKVSKEVTSLHEMQVMVQEATQRCKELGLNYDFYQQQILGAEDMSLMIKVVNNSAKLYSLWDPRRFLLFINLLRESENKYEIARMLSDSDLNWQNDVKEGKENKIGINTDYIKKRLSLNFQHLKETSHEEGEIISEKIITCLQEIKVKAENLRMYYSKEKSKERLGGRIVNAMKYLEMFLTAVQDDPLR